jgi:Domain of unknown function (DUF4149)
MKNILHHIATLLTTAWVGGLWAIGYLAAPVLFTAQPDKQLAGMLAGHMFTWMSYVGMACSTYLLWYYWRMAEHLPACKHIIVIIASMLLITLILQCGIQPMMAALKVEALPLDVMQSALAGRFKAMHSISQIIYLIQSLLGVFLLIKTSRV